MPPTSFDSLVARVRGEYREMPGVRLTVAQACRLWHVDVYLRDVVRTVGRGRFSLQNRNERLYCAPDDSQTGRLEESLNESCQIVGIRRAVGVRRCTDADDRAR